MRLRGLSSRRQGFGKNFRGDDERSDRNELLLKRRRGLACVSAGADEDFVRPDRAARGGQIPSGLTLPRLAPHGFDPSVLEDVCSRFHGGAGESGNVARRIRSGADFIDHASVIDG